MEIPLPGRCKTGRRGGGSLFACGWGGARICQAKRGKTITRNNYSYKDGQKTTKQLYAVVLRYWLYLPLFLAFPPCLHHLIFPLITGLSFHRTRCGSSHANTVCMWEFLHLSSIFPSLGTPRLWSASQTPTTLSLFFCFPAYDETQYIWTPQGFIFFFLLIFAKKHNFWSRQL